MAELLKGIRLFKKKDNQPDFVLATGVITIEELFDFIDTMKEHQTEYEGKKQLRIQVLRSKEGVPYMSVDTWKPDSSQNTSTSTSTASNSAPGNSAPAFEDDLPF